MNPIDYIKKGNSLLQQNLFTEAEDVFKSCLKLFPKNVGVKERLAFTAFSRKAYDDAYVRYSSLVNENPENISGYIGSANVLLKQGLLSDAKSVLKDCQKLFPGNLRLTERLGHIAISEGDYDEAYIYYSSLIKDHPENISGYLGLSNVLLILNFFDEAEECLGICVNNFPDNLFAKDRYANVALKKHNYEEAYIRYSQIISIDHEKISAYIGLAVVLFQQKLLAEAEELLEFCKENLSKNLGIDNLYAKVAFNKLEYDEAFKRYSKLIDDFPNIPTGYIGQGHVLLEKQFNNAAEKIFENCIKMFPDSFEAKERYAYIAFRNKDYEKAYARYSDLEANYPDKVICSVWKLRSLLSLGLYGEFENAVRKFRDKYKGCPSLYSNIIYIYNTYISYGIYQHLPSFTKMASSAMEHIDKYMTDDILPCFDRIELFHGLLLSAKNYSLNEIGRFSIDRGTKTIAVFGDSSVVTTLYRPDHFVARGFNPVFFSLGGATITGIGSSKSKLGLFEKIKKFAIENKPQYVVLKFGQGDIEFGYYYRKFLKNESDLDYVQFCEFLIETYQKRILILQELTNVIVHGIDLPSLIERKKCAKNTVDVITKDKVYEGDLSLFDELVAVQPSISERTAISLRFNSMLKDMCHRIGCFYADTEDIFLAEDGKTIDVYYQPDFDHHYKTTARIKEKSIDKVLEIVMCFL
ncbi:tetratricopeptide repeat protein [Maridesulfovibrio bastinii]|uniref:tetratricopeptide repeat protein n=1 Tax=Maridesulfovibrio bastinii TaxID=47157 RepID=UPI0004245E57|nr:tetratricopeptide repeat protein [Maridesulfovibrio bastinii]